MFEEKQLESMNFETSSVSNCENSDSTSECNSLLKKKYSVISQENRIQFIKRVLSKQVTIKQAAKEFEINFSTAKAILQTYKKEGRIGKKKHRIRKRSTNGPTVSLGISTSQSEPKSASQESSVSNSPSNVQNFPNNMFEKLPLNFDELKCLLASQNEKSMEKMQTPNQCPQTNTQNMEDLSVKPNIYGGLLNKFFEQNINTSNAQSNLFQFQGSEMNHLVENIIMLALKPEFNVTINKILKILHQECQSDNKRSTRQQPQAQQCANLAQNFANFSNQMNNNGSLNTTNNSNSFLTNFQLQNQLSTLLNGGKSANNLSSSTQMPQQMPFNNNNLQQPNLNEAQLLQFLKEGMQQQQQQQPQQVNNNNTNNSNKMLMEQFSKFMVTSAAQNKQEVNNQNQISDFLLQLRSKLEDNNSNKYE